jgi:hypothetical protein
VLIAEVKSKSIWFKSSKNPKQARMLMYSLPIPTRNMSSARSIDIMCSLPFIRALRLRAAEPGEEVRGNHAAALFVR